MTTKAAATPARKKTTEIFQDARSFCSFSVNDLKQAKEFYGQKLGLDVAETEEGLELNTGVTLPVGAELRVGRRELDRDGQMRVAVGVAGHLEHELAGDPAADGRLLQADGDVLRIDVGTEVGHREM